MNVTVDLAALPSLADLTGGAPSDHRTSIPLIVVGLVLFVVAGIVRKIIKLALLILLAGAVALVVAAWRSGLLTG